MPKNWYLRGQVRRTRSVSALYGALTMVLIVAALVMALLVRPPPPPSIAELGPSPQEQIEEARNNQAAGTGRQAAADSAHETTEPASSSAPGATTTTTTATTDPEPPPAEVPATRRCFGDPPRQTEDPHSPPCVFDIFQGNNGGVTAKGVTPTEVRVAWDFASECWQEEARDIFKALLEHFNRRYEFYGRRLAIDYIDNQPCTRYATPTETSAIADEVISRSPFASIIEAPKVYQGGLYRELANARIHSIMSLPPQFSPNEFIDGWTWLNRSADDANQRLGGDFICHAFEGRTARHAGPEVNGKPRKFAVMAVANANQGPFPRTHAVMEQLESCGANAQRFEYDTSASDSARRQLINQLRTNNFTTILPVPERWAYGPGLMMAATQQGYFPEWLIMDSNLADTETYWKQPGSQRQAPYAFGFTSGVKVQPYENTPAFWALQEGGYPGEPRLHTAWVEYFYQQLLLLAAGIQGAGAHLTPDSFRRTLWQTVWPNPNPGRPPFWQQEVSLGPGDPAFYDDYAIWWWNPDMPGQTNGGQSGRFCYLNQGARFSPGAFPQDADTRLFDRQRPCS